MLTILTSPSNLLTDYFALGSFGSAFINVGILTLLSVLLAYRHKVILNGPLFASILTVTGFSFFGKNLYNSISIILGVYLYAVFVNKPFSQYIMIGLFGSALSPVVSYITFGMRFPLLIGILLGNLAGIAIGLLLPPLAAQTLVFHRGFTLYNIGFTSGLIAMTFTAVLRLFSYSIVENTLVFNEYHFPLIWIIFGFFSLTVGIGFYYNSFRLSGIREIFDSSGKLTTDFIANSGIGATLINMGLVGLMLSSYVLLVGGQLNGPVIGAILSAVGFSAFGCHLKNSFPILVGIFIATLFGTFHEITSTGMLVAAVFGTGLAPISGFYGSFYGVIAGVLHIALVHNVSTLHGGLNLYNSGFSTGFVAGILVPILDNFTAVRKEKKTLGKRIIKKNHR
ncbi:DUF1576 domain-containing protein [Enterococcus faecium]|uniref:DUF1576 domain-containing protein n=1 Tax=Enterococcus faecium TaxID=1352 RepID=UPI00157252DF|nr:DUF1576 domain-containing protein [Enterococcus faecium]EHG8745180.1 DUF1576 domain-containing protein [Enterococcus faecium]NTM23070.1 DUF1576 domain-containing protein [Enterococcus faecium]NTM27347.1 DUF1576 domain-containing protein [Enterococcus faecium]